MSSKLSLCPEVPDTTIRKRTDVVWLNVNVFTCKLDVLVFKLPTLVQVEPLFVDICSCHRPPVSVPKLACETWTLVAPLTLKFIVRAPLARTRAD